MGEVVADEVRGVREVLHVARAFGVIPVVHALDLLVGEPAGDAGPGPAAGRHPRGAGRRQEQGQDGGRRSAEAHRGMLTPRSTVGDAPITAGHTLASGGHRPARSWIPRSTESALRGGGTMRTRGTITALAVGLSLILLPGQASAAQRSPTDVLFGAIFAESMKPDGVEGRRWRRVERNAGRPAGPGDRQRCAGVLRPDHRTVAPRGLRIRVREPRAGVHRGSQEGPAPGDRYNCKAASVSETIFF